MVWTKLCLLFRHYTRLFNQSTAEIRKVGNIQANDQAETSIHVPVCASGKFPVWPRGNPVVPRLETACFRLSEIATHGSCTTLANPSIGVHLWRSRVYGVEWLREAAPVRRCLETSMQYDIVAWGRRVI